MGATSPVLAAVAPVLFASSLLVVFPISVIFYLVYKCGGFKWSFLIFVGSAGLRFAYNSFSESEVLFRTPLFEVINRPNQFLHQYLDHISMRCDTEYLRVLISPYDFTLALMYNDSF